MDYYFLDGIERKGPYNFEEIKARKLDPNTMILKEGMEKWAPLTDFKELIITEASEIKAFEEEIINEHDESKGKSDDRKNKNLNRAIIIFFISVLVIFASYFIYQRFALTEDMARETSNRFFNLMVMKGIDNKTFEEIYPSFNGAGSRIVFDKICTINNVSRNSEGDYEVYATYQPGTAVSYPIFLLVGRENNKTIIKSSKGISFAYYDKVLEFGKRKGCLTGNENDAEMERIITEKGLRTLLELKTDNKLKSLYDNLEVKSSLKNEYGSIMGNVTIINNNNIDFGFNEIECRVDFYDRNGIVTSSEKVLSIFGVNAYGSVSGSVYSSVSNSVRYKVIPDIKSTYGLRNKVKEKIIAEQTYGC